MSRDGVAAREAAYRMPRNGSTSGMRGGPYSRPLTPARTGGAASAAGDGLDLSPGDSARAQEPDRVPGHGDDGAGDAAWGGPGIEHTVEPREERRRQLAGGGRRRFAGDVCTGEVYTLSLPA